MSQTFKRPCLVCGNTVNHIRRHINKIHLPWYMSPAYACASCQISGGSGEFRQFHSGHNRVEGDDAFGAWQLLVNGYLLFLSRCLGLESLDSLLSFVVSEHMFPQHGPFSEEEAVFLRIYDQSVGLEPKKLYTSSPPSRISELTNLNILTRLLQKLSPREQDSAMLCLSYSNKDGSSPPQGHPTFKLSIIDGHFHLDELIGRTGKTFKELELLSEPKIILWHAIANFVYPSKWGKIDTLMSMDARLSLSLGVHPHLLYRNNHESMFARLRSQLEKYPEAVAIGEVGLDFTTSCRCSVLHDRMSCVEGKIEAQHAFLERVLGLANQLDKPVIIHCRDRGDGSAAAQVLNAFVRCSVTHLKVQRHCFVGSSSEFDMWNKTLPNCYFSLSRQSSLDLSTREALLMADHDKLILETDSPYLSFPGNHYHGPWKVGEVARAISNLLGLPESQLVRISNRNISKLFGIKF